LYISFKIKLNFIALHQTISNKKDIEVQRLTVDDSDLCSIIEEI